MTTDPHQKLGGEESNILPSYFGISIENQSNKVISKMVLPHILKRREESKTQSHHGFSAMTPSENISHKVLLHYSEIVSYPKICPVNFCICMLLSSIFLTVESNFSIIINKDP